MSVLPFSAWGTDKYSQDRIAQKKAPIPSCPTALSVSVSFLLYIITKTWAGRAFCCFGLGSLLRKARKSLDKTLPRSPSSSFVGFDLPLSLKDEETLETAPLTVPSARVPSDGRENLPSRRAMAKAPMSLFLSCLENSSRYRSSSSPINWQYSVHLRHDLACSSCVFLVTASSREVSAAQRSEMRRFLQEVEQFRSALESVMGRKI